MNLLKKIISSKKILTCLLVLLIHIFLFNVNVAEWGDSYRILRASNYIKTYSYPKDEKRPPLYSAVLATNPKTIDSISWAKGVMLVISMINLFLFDKYLSYFVKDKKWQKFGILVFGLSPVILYWSLRIYADTFFLMLILLGINITKKEEKYSVSDLLFLGIIAGLGVMTRFEGYVLLGALGLGILLHKRGVRNAIIFSIFAFLTCGYYLYLRNPLNSTYFEEPSGRTYDLKMFGIYLISMLFSLGIIPAFFHIFKNFKETKDFLFKHITEFSFLVVELVLILFWPAAIPRLFIPVIPIFVLLYCMALEKIDLPSKKDFLIGSMFFVFYVGGQYFLRQQFLIISRKYMSIIVVLQFLAFISLFWRRTFFYRKLLLVSMFLWSLITINSHKNIYISVKNAAEYANANLEGYILYNDVSSISDWYLNHEYSGRTNSGKYYNIDPTEIQLSEEQLESVGVDYLIITNEHNTSMEIDFEKRPYLKVVKNFEYEVNGQEFFAKIVRYEKTININTSL